MVKLAWLPFVVLTFFFKLDIIASALLSLSLAGWLAL